MARERQGSTALVNELPDCAICKQEGYNPVRKGRYDGATVMGTWAFMCTMHFRLYGRGLGTGVGQKLAVRDRG
jgi:hypothetical protein